MKRNPFAGGPEAPADGQKLFAQNCAQCHGATAKGNGHAPSLVNAWIQHATPGELFWVITNGSIPQGMPSWSKLADAQRWEIVAFLKSINTPRSAH
jgi:mono/diheme cytochrome c family protein